MSKEEIYRELLLRAYNMLEYLLDGRFYNTRAEMELMNDIGKELDEWEQEQGEQK